MALPILEIPKRYKDGQPYFEAFVDDIKFSAEEWALAIVRSMNQFGQDVFGSNYPFNNNGLPTRVIPLIDYLAALSENETVTGNWTFSGATTFGGVTFGGAITVAGTATFNGASTFNAAVTFNSTTTHVGLSTFADVTINGALKYQDSTNSFYYNIVPSALAADRNLTLPTLLGNDVFVFADFIQTLQNKTLVTPTIASFINANHNHSDSANGGTIDHGALTGLGDDDHPQYPLAGGTETIGGNWTFSNNIGVPDNNFALSKLVQVSTDSFLGRDTAGTGNVESINASQAAAIVVSGLANDAISFSKLQNIATDRILGRTTSGSGDIEELTASQAIDVLGIEDRLIGAGAQINSSGTVLGAAPENIDAVTHVGTGEYDIDYTNIINSFPAGACSPIYDDGTAGWPNNPRIANFETCVSTGCTITIHDEGSAGAPVDENFTFFVKR